MTDSEGTYSQLVDIAEKKGKPKKSPAPARSEKSPPNEQPREDLTTTPYISQNYRFTEDELRWLRRQSYNLTERLGGKVSQNTILRVALRLLRDACTRNPKRNPLVEAVSELKR
jgi:hypothetical protein